MIHTSNIKISSTDIITPRFLQGHVATSNLKEIHNSSQLHWSCGKIHDIIHCSVHGACLIISCRYAVTLSRNNGLMQTPAKIQSRKRKGSPGPSAPRPQTPGPAQPGPVPVGRIQAKRMHCNDATGQWSAKTWRYMGCSTTGWRETKFSYRLILISYLHRIRYRQIPLSLSLSLFKYGWIICYDLARRLLVSWQSHGNLLYSGTWLILLRKTKCVPGCSRYWLLRFSFESCEAVRKSHFNGHSENPSWSQLVRDYKSISHIMISDVELFSRNSTIFFAVFRPLTRADSIAPHHNSTHGWFGWGDPWQGGRSAACQPATESIATVTGHGKEQSSTDSETYGKARRFHGHA